jgi:hypothetical protein
VSDHRDQIGAILDEAQGLQYGPTRVALTEEAVRLADAHADEEEGFDARLKLMTAAVFSGRPDVLMVAFAWCLARYDREPEKFPDFNLLWNYKWVADNLPSFPDVSREQVEAMLNDMERRYRSAGASMHPVHGQWRDALLEMGDLAGARRAAKRMASTPRGYLSNCPACVLDADVDFLVCTGRDEDAVSAAEPIVQGRMRCAEVPHRTLPRLLLPLVRMGRVSEAMTLHRKSYRMIAANPKFIPGWSNHVLLLALTDNMNRAVKLLETHWHDSVTAASRTAAFQFLCAAKFVFDRLVANGTTELRLRLPSGFALHQEGGVYDVRVLAAWVTDQARELAERFDARNGNKAYSRRLAALKKPHKLVTPYPITSK